MMTVLLLFVSATLVPGLTADSSTLEPHVFPVDIGAEGHIVQGRISYTAQAGTLVPFDIIEEGREESDLKKHLRVEIRRSTYKRPHVYHKNTTIDRSDPENLQFDHPIIQFTNNTLPPGMEFVVIHSNAFIVNEDRYIVVNDFDHIEEEENLRIKFEVVLKDVLSQVHYVSNHLPFVVEIEFPRHEHNANSALFAGVLILTIVTISLLIPFVVRAKRRSKAGKPICGCGSAEDGSDNGSTGSGPEMMKGKQMSVGGKDNLAMILDRGGFMQPSPSGNSLNSQFTKRSIDPHTTIQNAMLRSTSNINFQPHWLDPHYRDVYDRPEYFTPGMTQPVHQGHPGYPNGYVNPAFVRGPGSSRSSLDSRHEYPANFNPNMMPLNTNGGLHLQIPPRTNGKIPTTQKEQHKEIHGNGNVASMNSKRVSTHIPPKVLVTDAEVKEQIQTEVAAGATGGENDATSNPPSYENVTSERL